MRCAWLVWLLGVPACNAVFGLDPVDRGPRDGATDAEVDVPVDADPCVTDDFEGSALDPHWSLSVGALPVASDVSGSRVLIADAPFAPTPSMPTASWIYELDADKGNQLAWAQPIDTADFALDADLGWSSTNGELTLAGVGVADATGRIAAYAGARDGSSVNSGHALAQLLRPAMPDLVYAGTEAEPGAGQFRIARTAGVASLSVDEVEVLAGPMPAAIAAVVIVYVRYKLDGIPQPFGSFEVRRIRLCR